MSIFVTDTWAALEELRRQRPLVHNITNYVVMNTTANVLLAVGASPVMAHAPQEVEEMVGFSRALVLNMGTLSAPWVEAMVLAGQAANRLGVPVVFDPVGVGATAYRNQAARDIMDHVKVAVVRSNLGEALALAGLSGRMKGVDSLSEEGNIGLMACEISSRLKTTVAVTGAVDAIANGSRTVLCRNGHPLMGRVTGMGCSATAVVAAFVAVNPDPLTAAAQALSYFGLCGELAAKGAEGPGSFEVALRDRLYGIGRKELHGGQALEELEP